MSQKAIKEKIATVLPPEDKQLVRASGSTDLLDPKKESTKIEYMQVYNDYTTNNLTEKQLSQRYNYTPQHISSILKWCVTQLDGTDQQTKTKALIDKLRIRQQTIEAELPHCKNAKEKTLVYGELRKTDSLIAQLEGMLSTALIDMSDRRQVNMSVSDSLKRRRGGVDAG